MSFIKGPHPKHSVIPKPDNIQKYLGLGWIAQPKMNGYRCQVHVVNDNVILYTRQGTTHTRPFPSAIKECLLKTFSNGDVIEGEWLFLAKEFYLFDYLKRQDKILNHLNWQERFALLPQTEGTVILKLPVLTDLESCMKYINNDNNKIEGLVFKGKSRGFSDDSIVRSRKPNFKPCLA